MIAGAPDRIERGWARLGVQLACAPAEEAPDLERLIVCSPAAIKDNPRLFSLLVTWLVKYHRIVADHRLAAIVIREADAEGKAILGLVIESARTLGDAGLLPIALRTCCPLPTPRVLFTVDRESTGFARIAERTATPLSRRWGLLAPEAGWKPESIRPISWIRTQNPGCAERLLRSGDLRCSIVEALHRDTQGRESSKSDLSRLCGATKAATLAAIERLEGEGAVEVVREPGKREHRVRLIEAA